jgi:O-acetyl-ADP-ribose deacetylase (regulator of RNase III)
MKIVNGNILDRAEGIIVQQVNTLGIAGAGLALQTKKKYPLWYEDYYKFCKATPPELGTINWTLIHSNSDCKPQLILCNLFGQKTLGGKATIEEAYDIALPKIKHLMNITGLLVFMPYKIGCGLGGGDWDVIEKLIEQYIPETILVNYEV